MARKAKRIHTYTITLHGPGYEFLMGKLPKRIWRYINTEYGGNVDAYLEKWGEDLPENMQLWEGRPNVWDASADEEHLDGFLCYEVSGCAGMNGAQIDVHDEDGNLVYATEFMKLGMQLTQPATRCSIFGHENLPEHTGGNGTDV